MSAPRDYLDYLDDIAGAIDAIANFLQGLDPDGFRNDIKTILQSRVRWKLRATQ
jgi:uncharacterized protein with HEPN domain